MRSSWSIWKPGTVIAGGYSTIISKAITRGIVQEIEGQTFELGTYKH